VVALERALLARSRLPMHAPGTAKPAPGCVLTQLLHGAAARPMLLLGSYLAYWVTVVLAKADKVTLDIMLTAVLISAIVGTGINAGAIGSTPLCTYLSQGPFRCVRFYAIPFCVSSLSSIASSNKAEFKYLFPKDDVLYLALGVSAGYVAVIYALDRLLWVETVAGATSA
jgi:hypothetical protein